MDQFGQWRASLRPIRVDVVGDFAGRGVFAIHGESLLTHCLESSRVDLDYGFQLLHAVHAVETFLAKLKERRCTFNILWFEGEADVCIPSNIQTSGALASKYRLARAVLIQHFAVASGFSHVFPSIESSLFREYLDTHPLHFFLGSKDDSPNDSLIGGATRHKTPFKMLYLMASAGYCVAFIEGVEFKSSKAYLSMTTPQGNVRPLVAREDQSTLSTGPSPPMVDMFRRLVELDAAKTLTAREFISICALAAALRTSNLQEANDAAMPQQREAAALLLHLVYLRHLELGQRSFPKRDLGTLPTTSTPFLTKVFKAALDGLTAWCDGNLASLTWDAFDLFDGRLYLNVCMALSDGTPWPPQVLEEFRQMAKLLNALSGARLGVYALSGHPVDLTVTAATANDDTSLPEPTPRVLPFTHPVMDNHLADVRLCSDDIPSQSLASGKVFQELVHWHNAKLPLDPKHVPKAKGYFAAKKHQKFMSDTIAYSASLTGASGKNIEPESIVVQTPSAKLQIATRVKDQAQRTKQKSQKSNKQKALDHGEALRLGKLVVKSQSVASTWKERCLEFDKQPSLLKRYLRAEKYASDLSSANCQIIGAEVLLYLGDVLLRIQSDPQTPKTMAPSLFAMIWSKHIEASKLPLTEHIASRLRALEASLQLRFPPQLALPSADRPLAFKPLPLNGTKLLPSDTTSREFLLEHCGPYLERSFDSAPDPRVPSFLPDAWQRQVLDAIDTNKSVLAVAPTSAGKTFISFYAMKKVLQANDDDILVYVAPTKALVNQIAAEVQARFSKQYGSRAGKSVWAIHTRDYRVNSPKGCQVLVTVPSILQILLLAPANAKRPVDFSRRIKRIIFDEVHCIGQADDGVVWEQLLLLAPCPIIALSATIANPHEFRAWLEQSQKTKGFELEMIVHSSRYSDLRKFIHDSAPAVSEFTGLAPVERLPLPGLDSESVGDGNTSPFLFVHPVASIVDKNRDTLSDTSLEPRDCLTLWRCMVKHQSPQYPLSPALDPERALPEGLQKSDVVEWEKLLKDQLGEWMVDPKSPFDAVRQELRGQRYAHLADSYSPEAASSSGQPLVQTSENWPKVSSVSTFSLVTDLRTSGALPGILFSYDRMHCEAIVTELFTVLVNAESHYRETSAAWKAKIAEFEAWKKAREAATAKSAKKAANSKKGGHRGDDDDRQDKANLEREAGNLEGSKWESFGPDAALTQFSFADTTKITSEELEERLRDIHPDSVREPFIDALRRGVAVHHAGMNRHYRQTVEMLFRKGFLTVVVATGTLAMGINMPCKTVVFTGDSIYLTALNYRQASGRAGRRGFDVLGNVVFHNMPPHRALEIMSARLPDLRGQFPTSVSLILRLFILLHGTNNSQFAADAVRSLLTQNRLYMGGPEAKMSIAHHLRFSIDYLRRQNLLSATGVPLNFAGIVGHLYYTESAAFAFHALLQEGYFHALCAPYSKHMSAAAWRALSLELVLTLSHLFLRRPVTTNTATQNAILPPLPERAHAILAAHNAQTLSIFRAYVHSYATQHLASTPDNSLPYTNHRIPPSISTPTFTPSPLHNLSLPPTTIRSPFAALSGFTDADFATPSELCDTARAGVPLEASAVPGVELDGKLNSHLLDFFKHGDVAALARENGVGGAEVWFVLRDFELVLAAVGAGLEGFLNTRDGEEDGEEDGEGEGEGVGGEEGDWEEEGLDGEWRGREREEEEQKMVPVGNKEGRKRGKKTVVDSWEDEEVSEEDDAEDVVADEQTESVASWDCHGDGQSLLKVYRVFRAVEEEFKAHFKKMWA